MISCRNIPFLSYVRTQPKTFIEPKSVRTMAMSWRKPLRLGSLNVHNWEDAEYVDNVERVASLVIVSEVTFTREENSPSGNRRRNYRLYRYFVSTPSRQRTWTFCACRSPLWATTSPASTP